MGKLIDSDEFIKRIAQINDLRNLSTKTIGEAIDATPEAVVRCRNCRYCRHWYRDKGLCDLWAEDGIDVWEDGYCSYGKRNEGKWEWNPDPRCGDFVCSVCGERNVECSEVCPHCNARMIREEKTDDR